MHIEEVDEKILFHVEHASRDYTRVMIKTVDNDIVILAIASSHQLKPLNILWIELVQ